MQIIYFIMTMVQFYSQSTYKLLVKKIKYKLNYGTEGRLCPDGNS